jgi:transposase
MRQTVCRRTARSSYAPTSRLSTARSWSIDYLPAYAPDMNPVECIWGYLKHHAMPNYCARDLGDVACRARNNLRSMQRRTTLVQAFWKQVDLF